MSDDRDVRNRQATCHRLFRLVIRAYYPIEFGVVTDTLLRMLGEAAAAKTTTNCIAIVGHQMQAGVGDVELCQRLRLSPKLVREVLLRLRVDQLLCNVQSTVTTAISSKAAMRPRRLIKRVPRVKSATTWFVDWSSVAQTIRFRHSEMMAKMSAVEPNTNAVFFNCPSCNVVSDVMDLMMSQPKHNGTFHCDDCFTRNTATYEVQPVALVLQPNKADQLHVSCKIRFNAQVAPIHNELVQVENMIQQRLSLDTATATSTLQPSTVDVTPTVRDTTNPTKIEPLEQHQKPAIKVAEADTKASLSILEAFQASPTVSFTAPIATATAAAAAAAATVSEEEFFDAASEEASMLFQGKLVLVSQLTQEDLDVMTAQEFEEYSQFFDDDDAF